MALSSAHMQFKANLESKYRELARSTSFDGIHVVRSADVIEDIRLAAERDLATADLERRSGLMRQVAAALVRLEDGQYGICVQCAEQIAPARLRSVPWTPHCLHCQEAAEREAADRAHGAKRHWAADDTALAS